MRPLQGLLLPFLAEPRLEPFPCPSSHLLSPRPVAEERLDGPSKGLGVLGIRRGTTATQVRDDPSQLREVAAHGRDAEAHVVEQLQRHDGPLVLRCGEIEGKADIDRRGLPQVLWRRKAARERYSRGHPPGLDYGLRLRDLPPSSPDDAPR